MDLVKFVMCTLVFQATHDVLYTYKRVHIPWKQGTFDKLNQIPYFLYIVYSIQIQENIFRTCSINYFFSYDAMYIIVYELYSSYKDSQSFFCGFLLLLALIPLIISSKNIYLKLKDVNILKSSYEQRKFIIL